MKRTGMGLVGPGFIAAHHIDAVRRLGDVDIVGIAGSTQESAVRKAKQLGVARAYGDYHDLIADPDIDVVHNTTPNYLHFPVAMAALQAGKHVISDKPLAMTAEEGRKLRDAALDAKVAHVVTFNYRGNPLVQQARCMIAKGELGDLRFAHGVYLQDWMTDPHVYSWRSDPLKGGISSALGDIGSHWCDLVEHISGAKIQAVIADLRTTIPMRYTTGVSADAFSADNSGKHNPVRVNGEDLANVLLRFENDTMGSLSVGQALPGHKNDLQVEVCGSAMSLKWKQEHQNELWIGYHDRPNCVMTKDPALVAPEVRPYIHLPGGHQEAWSDAFYNVIRDAYCWVRENGVPEAKPQMLPTFCDGYRSTCVVEAMLRSHAAGNTWERVMYVPGISEAACRQTRTADRQEEPVQ
jgi:predicted dehydrogenase